MNIILDFEMYFKCMQIENMVKMMVLGGESDNYALVEAVDEVFSPQNPKEQEMFSEAIIYAKFSILN